LVSRLRAIGVVSDRGLQIGRLTDVTFDERDGRILSLLVRPVSSETLSGISRDDRGNVVVPFNAVMSIRDFIVVNERVLAIQQLKAKPPESPPEE
jgi:sporulation protein YlmC with PRC-barrel domain